MRSPTQDREIGIHCFTKALSVQPGAMRLILALLVLITHYSMFMGFLPVSRQIPLPFTTTFS